MCALCTDVLVGLSFHCFGYKNLCLFVDQLKWVSNINWQEIHCQTYQGRHVFEKLTEQLVVGYQSV